MQDFAAALGAVKSASLPALLVDEDCLVDNYISLCEQEIRRLSYRSVLNESPTDLERWQLEKQTWILTKQLLTLRSSSVQQEPNYALIDGSDRELVSCYLTADPQVAEYNAVREWLENIAPPIEPVESRKGYRPYTIREIEKSGDKLTKYVSEVDPDASLRYGKPLHPDDRVYQESFLKCLFGFIRRGQMSKALQLCNSCGEHWRAASLLGGRYFHDPNSSGADVETSPPVGNRNRGQWMFVCFAIANEPSLDLYERATYAAMCGNTANIFPVCKSWEDVLWAFFHSLVISCSEKFPRIRGEDHKEFLPPGLEDFSAADVFSVLKSIGDDSIRKENQNIFRQLQLAIISGSTNDFFADFLRQLKNRAAVDSEFLRFIVHLIILMRNSGTGGDEETENQIISIFVDYLISQEKGEYVLNYTACVPYDLQILFMSNLLQNSDMDAKSRDYILKKSYQLGMDVKEITKLTVQNIVSLYPTSKYAGCPVLNLDRSLEVPETRQITAIEWLLLEQAQYLDALIQCNALFRKFLISGKLNAVVALKKKVESSSARFGSLEFAAHIRTLKKYENMIREMVCYANMVDALEKLHKWNLIFTRKPGRNRGFNSDYQDLSKWKTDMKSVTIDVEEALRKVVLFHDRMNWLEDQEIFGSDLPDGFQNDERTLEMSICREVYIPWIISQLFSVLFETRYVLPGNSSKALDIANTVADDGRQIWQLYEVVPDLPSTDPRSSPRMEKFLKQVMEGYKAFRSK